ncbi:hypothetical protein GCM10020229_60500 [Kitasatospora albolonga]|uniref:cupredoxin domain-containing protein n=1 Tax=Kitasatospora albolonga TaxID=68173 RepID=UPI00338C1835
MSVRRSHLAALLTVAVAGVALTACTEQKKDVSSDGAVQVNATDSACELSKTTFPAGPVNFSVTNKGSKTTEVYVYAAGDKIVTERENIGPGTKATITAEIKAGEYEVACKPGMVGDGIRQKITVTGDAAQAKSDPRLTAAVTAYRTYVQEQADATMPLVRKFADAVKAGDLEAAKAAYAPSGWAGSAPSRWPRASATSTRRRTSARTAWSRARRWTGWHKLEKSLWADGRITTRTRSWPTSWWRT